MEIKQIKNFLNKQIIDLKRGGLVTLSKKIITTINLIIFIVNPFYYIAILFVIFSRLISPFYLIRWGQLHSVKLGHFAMNTELYCCKREVGINVPARPYIDFFCFEKFVCNKQLSLMWNRQLKIFPNFFLYPIIRVNRIISKIVPGGDRHDIHSSDNIYFIKDQKKFERISTHRDIYNLLEKTKPHLNFTEAEINKGEKYLKEFGLPQNSKIVCLIVRDSAYLKKYFGKTRIDFSYHDYRDQNIENYLQTAEELSKRGYYVFRMGNVVSQPMHSSNPKIIDYANSKIKNDFLDVYLSYKCTFCIRTAGFGALPQIFRKPIVYIEGPLVDLTTEDSRALMLLPNYYSKEKKRILSLKEIFTTGVLDIRTNQGYQNLGIEVQNNTSEEIKDITIEMADRLEGKWQTKPEDILLQKKFLEIFEKNLILYKKRNLFGKIKSKYSSNFIKNNPNWLSN